VLDVLEGAALGLELGLLMVWATRRLLGWLGRSGMSLRGDGTASLRAVDRRDRRHSAVLSVRCARLARPALPAHRARLGAPCGSGSARSPFRSPPGRDGGPWTADSAPFQELQEPPLRESHSRPCPLVRLPFPCVAGRKRSEVPDTSACTSGSSLIPSRPRGGRRLRARYRRGH
jgi:hypothetical protein